MYTSSALRGGHRPSVLPVPTQISEVVGDLSTPITVGSLFLLLRLVRPPITRKTPKTMDFESVPFPYTLLIIH